MPDVVVIGAGPAGVVAALRAADLGAKTALVARGAFGGMAAEDGPVPVRTLAHAARLMREARQLPLYGIEVGQPTLSYPQLLARVRQVCSDVGAHSALRPQIDALGVAVHERAGSASFVDPHTIVTDGGLRLSAERIIICTGGLSRPLSVPGAELAATHSGAWGLTSVPASMLVIGGGATGAQVASIFSAFGSRVQLFETGPRILRTEDEDVSTAMAAAFRQAGIVVREQFGAVEAFERAPGGVRMILTKDGARESVEATLAVVAVGWVASTAGLGLDRVGVTTDERGFVGVDACLQTSAPHIFAAGDITGHLLLVPQAIQEGFIAGTNAVRGPTMVLGNTVQPIGSFTDPEYAGVGLTEARARESLDVVAAAVPFDATTRSIIDGRTTGFCKLIVDRTTSRILGCHVVGERAVDIVAVAAIAMNVGMRVDALAQMPLPFPTHSGILGRAAARAARDLNLTGTWQANRVDDAIADRG
jgi:pyruvate/2-oxoglutarate dehydrogenase complex dihydrolipoamide dehydrogenase (E3) component